MNKQNRKLKALVLSTAMAALLLVPQTSTAQYDESRYGLQPWFGSSVMGRESGGNREGNGTSISGGISNLGIGQNDAPLGSGIAILLAAGLGYVALKKKED